MSDLFKPAGSTPEFYVNKSWQVLRLWDVARLRSEKNRPNMPLLSIFLHRGVIKYGEGGGQVHKPGLDLSVYQVVRKGDFVLNNQQAWRGSVGVSKYEGIISPAYIVLSLSDCLNSSYGNYLFQARPMVDQYVTASKGVGDIQRDIHTPWLKNIRVPIPSYEEQTNIVRFLDWANDKIDRTIRAKRKVISLLNEQKQAIIHKAVTRGLNPSVKLKPSGIPWLGNIPVHWGIQPVKQLLARMDYGTSESSSDDGKFRVLTMGHIKDGEIIVPPVGSGGIDFIPKGLKLETNDLLFNRTNSPELVGKVGIFKGSTEDEVTFASYLVRLRVRSDNDPHWLNYLLGSCQFWAFARSHALVSLHQANLNSTRYGRMLVPVPPTDEQRNISEFLSGSQIKFNTVTHREQNEINLLLEFRTRLISDIVTGKLDVRTFSKRIFEDFIHAVIPDEENLVGEEGLVEEVIQG